MESVGLKFADISYLGKRPLCSLTLMPKPAWQRLAVPGASLSRRSPPPVVTLPDGSCSQGY